MSSQGHIVSNLFFPPSTRNSKELTDDLPEQPGARDDSDYQAEDGEGNEDPTLGKLNRVTTEQTAGADTVAHTVDRSDEGESSNDAEPEQVQQAGDGVSAVEPYSSDERPGQPVGAVKDDGEQGTVGSTHPENGFPAPTEGLDAAAAHEQPDDHNTSPLGENSTEYEEE